MSTETGGSPSTPETVISPDAVEKIEKDKQELLIYIYHRRTTYFKRWENVTAKYLRAIENKKGNNAKIWESKFDDCSSRFKERIDRKLKSFSEKYPYYMNDDGHLSFLDGLDVLVKPSSEHERTLLIEKEKIYHTRHERMNPTTPARTPGEEKMPDKRSKLGQSKKEDEVETDEASTWPSEADST